MPQPVGPMSRMLDLAISTSSMTASADGDRVAGPDALVVVVDGDRQGALGGLLADDVLLEEGENLLGLRQFELAGGLLAGFSQPLLDDLVAQFDAFVADVNPGAGDELLHLLLAFATERALEQIGALTNTSHFPPPSGFGRSPRLCSVEPNLMR